ncbi:MAG: T9SS type A sorting domain-containing protein [Melioribacteraceae bacterium]|nr:T9SS type A sorting domain-containing protein [Melioribacteraceae bacterium]
MWYRLKQIDNDGAFAYSKVRSVELSAVTSVDDDELNYEFSLAQNYPNPFNPTTTIKYTIPTVETGHALSLRTKLIVYDILGQQIKTLVNEVKSPGNYEVVFNASQLHSGVYFYTLNYGEFTQTRKLLLIK